MTSPALATHVSEPMHDRAEFDAGDIGGPTWVALPSRLREHGVGDRLSSSTGWTLLDWERLVETLSQGPPTVRLVHAGVSLDDLVSWKRTYPTGSFDPEVAAQSMAWELYGLRVLWPQLLVRDAVGWLLLGGAALDRMAARDVAFGSMLAPWRAAGLPGGWLFAAAGMSADEARTHVDAGTADMDALVALAVLRGVALPAVA